MTRKTGARPKCIFSICTDDRGRYRTIYEGAYEDARGRFPATFENDGRVLRLKVLDAVFEGKDFDQLSVVSAGGSLDGFTFYGEDLCSCVLHVGLGVGAKTLSPSLMWKSRWDGGIRASTTSASDLL